MPLGSGPSGLRPVGVQVPPWVLPITYSVKRRSGRQKAGSRRSRSELNVQRSNIYLTFRRWSSVNRAVGRMRYSERIRAKAPREAVQVNSMDGNLSTSLWNTCWCADSTSLTSTYTPTTTNILVQRDTTDRARLHQAADRGAKDARGQGTDGHRAAGRHGELAAATRNDRTRGLGVERECSLRRLRSRVAVGDVESRTILALPFGPLARRLIFGAGGKQWHPYFGNTSM